MIASTSDNLIERLFFGTAEKTLAESAYVYDSQVKPYNPDDLVQKDVTYCIYEEMLKDDQVSAALKLKKDLILNTGFEIVVFHEEHEPIKKLLEKAIFEDTARPFIEQLEEIISAYEFGFSLSEKIFQKQKDLKLTLNQIKTRHPASWLIHTDPFGNVKKYEQVGTLGESNIVDPRSLLHFINQGRFSNPYGTSDLRAAYNAWFIKRQIIKFYAIFLEKHASPIPVGRYDKNAPQSAVTKLLNILKRFQQKTAIVIPKEIEVEFLQSANSGEAYTTGIDQFNMFIGRSLMMPDLVGLSGSETGGGSFALGAEHINIYNKHIQKRKKQLEAAVNDHIIKPLVIYNFGFIDEMPEFRLAPIEDTDIFESARIFIQAIQAGVYRPSEDEINHLRETIGYPQGEVELGEVHPIDLERMQSFTTKGRVDFKLIETTMDDAIESINKKAKPIIEKAYEDFYRFLEEKDFINTGRVEDIKFDQLEPLSELIKSELLASYKAAQSMAQKEIKKTTFSEPIVGDLFLKFLEIETFEAIGKWKFKVEESARVAMIAAIKDGLPLSSVIELLDENQKPDTLDSIERYSRTKETEVINKGRVDYFDRSGMVQGYQYSAVLDGQTTEICKGLDGKMFKIGEQPIPPMHFNCRSILIPITIGEDFNPADKSIDKFIENNKGKGFPKQ